MKTSQLLEAEYPPNPSTDPPHRTIKGNNSNDIVMQIYHREHHLNVRPAGVAKYGQKDGTWKEVPYDKSYSTPNGKVALIAKAPGWAKSQQRVYIHYEDIDEVIAALQYAKQQLEEQK